jgi:hypothetical protein
MRTRISTKSQPKSSRVHTRLLARSGWLAWLQDPDDTRCRERLAHAQLPRAEELNGCNWLIFKSFDEIVVRLEHLYQST